jgi:hypothetical protein
MVFKEVIFKTGFQELKGASFKTDSIPIDMSYNETEIMVPTHRLRQGGDSHAMWSSIVNKDATKAFETAENFFDAGKTPQDDLT